MPPHRDAPAPIVPSALTQAGFFAVPPFPGSKLSEFTRLPDASDWQISLPECVALVREYRVGGTYWGAQPELPSSYALVRSAAALSCCDDIVEEPDEALLWLETAAAVPPECRTITGVCDPWHMLSGARALVCDPADEVRFVAAILGIPTYLLNSQGSLQLWDGEGDTLLADALPVAARFSNPFGGDCLDLVELIKLCGFWRSMIDANRSICGAVGFAFWKQQSVLPLLWSGGETSAFFCSSAPESSNGAIAIWRSKTPPAVIDRLERQGTTLIEVEDGFLRSNGLGADCVPPLSITVDRLGSYFDPSQPSELENLLQNGLIDDSLVVRAGQLREMIVAAGLGKYDRGDKILDRFHPTKRHVLVTGQVEDDRSVLTGGSGLVSNFELLKRVRAQKPDAYLIYKPHPDVLAGHRRGDIADHLCRQFSDEIVTDLPISSLITMADEVHVNTSLAGFEALVRRKKVTTYGVPFYAGWGLTNDLGPVPARRTTKRSLDQLIAATLLMYPRYLDPITGLPCPAEVVVDRLSEPGLAHAGPLVRIRRWQGRWKRRLSTWRLA